MANNISLTNSTAIFDGQTITGWSKATDALTIPAIQVLETTYGADGIMTVTNTGTKGGDMTFKFSPNSQGAQFFSSLVELEKISGISGEYLFTLTNHTTGATLTATKCVIKSHIPFPTLGKGEIGELEYIIGAETIIGELATANFS